MFMLAIELALPLGGGGGRGVERRRGAEVAPQAGEALAPRGGGLHRRTNLSRGRGEMAIGEANDEDLAGQGRLPPPPPWIRLRRWNFRQERPHL